MNYNGFVLGGRRTEIKRKPCESYWLPSLQRWQFCWQARWLGKPMPKPRAEHRISPHNHKILRLFNEQPAEDRDPIAPGDLSGAAVRTVVGARPAGAIMVVMAIARHIGGVGAIVGGKSELLGVREAASAGGLFFLWLSAVSARSIIRSHRTTFALRRLTKRRL